MKRPIQTSLLLLALTPALADTPPSGDQYQVSRSTFDGGGQTSAAGAYQVRGTIGQPDAGPTLGGGTFTLRGGFWSGDVAPTESLFRDGFESGAGP